MMEDLRTLIADEAAQPVPEIVHRLAEAIARCGRPAAILFYGSGLWKAAAEDTIYDFYVLVDRFADFDAPLLAALLGFLIPPNVYYLEVQDGARTLRCKYALMRRDQFARAARGRASTPQIWARFAQPCRIVMTRDDNTRSKLAETLAQAVLTFHRRALPLAPAKATPREIWLRGLAETYAAELRSEKPERTQELFDAAAVSYTRRTETGITISVLGPARGPARDRGKPVEKAAMEDSGFLSADESHTDL